ncbi:MAG TPA: PKD domain-containing protein [Prolixibacteraceae bacterium]|nr:PKD domain-containing protein [Prolixibacteraceae bacterium]
MKAKITSFLLIVSCLFPLLIKAQTGDACHYSTEGTDFWFGFMQNRDKGEMHYLEITVTSRTGADITITYGPGEEHYQTDYVAANSSVTFRLDTITFEPDGSEIVEGKAIHLVASSPVSVYALNYKTQSSDVAIIYPTKSLGKEYYAMCYTPHPTNTTESNSEFLIVASEDNTLVEITPTRDTDQGHKANQSFAVRLNKGQLYQVQSMNRIVEGQGDLTGSKVVSDKPVAFYSGVKSTSVPFEGRTRDHLYEQIPPTSTWGKEFYVVPLESRVKDTYRILAAEDGTVVKIGGIDVTISLNSGQYREFDLDHDDACRIISNKRILLAQFCRSQDMDNGPRVGDPFMIIISPVVQKINDITFEAYRSELITSMFFVNVVTLTSEVKDITLDEGPVNHYFHPFSDGIYSYARIPILSGTHRLRSNQPEGGFLAYVYGFGDRGDTESYGYGVGFNLDVQLDLADALDSDTLKICSGDEKKLDAGNYFAIFDWSTGEDNQFIMVSKEGWVSVTAITSGGCVKMDSVYAKVEHLTVDLGDDRGPCMPSDRVLDAGPGFKSYLWQDGSINQTFVVEKTGTYSVKVTNENNCTASDSVKIVVFEPLFTQNYTVATDQHPEITFTSLTEYAVSYSWDFGDGHTSTDIHPVHRYDQVGEYTVILEATSESGCSDTIRSTVKIVPFLQLTPNAFRPDSEIAENRVFRPVTEGIDPARYQLQIFNRVGSTVFESTNHETGWDGRMSNGTLADPGIFIWLIRYSDVQGFPHQDKGTVMLVR